MTTIASQITSLTVVFSTVYSDVDQRKHQSSASLAFVWGIHRDRWIPRTKGSYAENVSIWWRHHADSKMDSSAAAKRRRYSTGGTSEAVTRDGLPFSMVAAESEVCQMSDSEKLNFIIGKLQSIESLTLELQRTRVRLDEAHDMIDQMYVAMTKFKDELTMAQHRIIDLEARSRRQNLIFAGIPENGNESDSDCKTTLLSIGQVRLGGSVRNYFSVRTILNSTGYCKLPR